MKGFPTSRGVVRGAVFRYCGDDDAAVPEYVVPLGGEAAELETYRGAVKAAREDLERILSSLRERPGRDDGRILEAHLMMLDDPVMIAETERSIAVGRLNAASAVRRTADGFRAKFAGMEDPYFRERVRDLDDVERRLLRHLAGREADAAIELPGPSVFVARDLSPSEAVRLPVKDILAIVLEGGSPVSHVALLARAMGVPAVTGVENAFAALEPGADVFVDGTLGRVVVNPGAAELAACRRSTLRAAGADGRPDGTPGRLKDGSGVYLFANMHPGLPTEVVRRSGATGVGLYRSEYLWLNLGREPTEEEQFAAYREAAEFAASLSPKGTLTLRTLDIGGDKIVRGLAATEANPFLGNRSIRYLLSHPETFRTQLRAILRASAFGKVCLLHPMISCVEELRAAAAVLEEVKAGLDRDGVAYDRMMPVGAMIEVPAAALNAAAIAREVDFFSIGTNDLVQYTMAADRGNEAVASLQQTAHPAVLELMRRVFAAARAADIPVGVCGESAADPVFGPLWVAMGADLLSVSAGYLPPLDSIFRGLTRADLDEYAAAAAGVDISLPAAEIRVFLRDWLRRRVPGSSETIL